MEKRLSDLLIPIEQDLASQSATSVPSVAAVKQALADHELQEILNDPKFTRPLHDANADAGTFGPTPYWRYLRGWEQRDGAVVATSANYLFQDFPAVVGTRYTLIIRVSAVTAGTLYLSNRGGYSNASFQAVISEPGTYTYGFAATNTTERLHLFGNDSFSGVVESASLSVRTSVKVEQDLSSNSASAVPSVAAIKQALGNINGQVAGDNLGNHTATQNLNLNGHDLVSSSGIVQVDGQLRVYNVPSQDVLYFKGGPGGAGSRAALAFDATGVGFGGNVSARINFVDDGAYGANILLETRTGSGGTDTQEQMRVQTNGNIGIGTAAPSQKLEVAGSVKAIAFLGDGSQLTGTVNQASDQIIGGNKVFTGHTLFIGNGGSDAAAGEIASCSSPHGQPAQADKFYTFSVNKSNYEALFFGINKDSATGQLPANTAFLSTYTTNGTLSFGRGNNAGLPSTSDLLIAGDGSVGVGIAAPSQKLEVAGNVKATAFLGDGSQLTGISQVTVEDDLGSNSAAHVPSVRAVKAAVDNAATSITTNANTINALQANKADLVNGLIPVSELPLATVSAPGIAQVGAGLVVSSGTVSTVAASNVTVQTAASGFPQPYSSLESAFAGYTALTYPSLAARTTYIRAKTLTLGASVTLSGYVKSEASTVYIPDGLIVAFAGSYYAENIVFDVPADAPSGTGKVSAPGLRSAPGEVLDASTFYKCRLYADLNVSGTLILIDTYVDNIVSGATTAATIYLYGSSAVGSVSSTSPNVIIVDRTQQNIVPLLPFPAAGSSPGITLQTGNRYFRDGSILQYAGKNNASSTAVAFSSADTVNWKLISSSGFTPTEVSAIKGGFSVFETVGESSSGEVPVHTPYSDLTLVPASANKTLNIHASSDAGWYFSSGNFANTQYINGNGCYISIGGGTLTFNYGIVVRDLTLSQYSIANWQLPSYQAAYLAQPSGFGPFFLVINQGDLTNPATCAQLINSNVYGEVMIGNTAVTLRDSYVFQFTYQGSSAFGPTTARVYLYGRSKFGAFNYDSARRTKVFDYRPYRDTLVTDASSLKFTEDTFVRLVTPAGAAVNVGANTAGFTPMAQCRLTIPATAGTVNLARNIKPYNDLVPGVENVLYLTCIASDYVICYINQPATVTGAGVVVVPELSGNSATSVPSVAAVAAYVASPKTYFASAAIRSAVTGGSFASGELQGTQPAGSTFGMRFADSTYQYTYGFAAADTDGTALAWVRTAKV